MNITIDTIRQFEADAANFDNVGDFARHVYRVIEAEYDAIQLNTHGGLLRSKASRGLDKALAAVYAEAGYGFAHSYEFGDLVWARMRGEG